MRIWHASRANPGTPAHCPGTSSLIVAGTLNFGLGLLDRVRGLTERHARRKIEADGDRRELPLVADRQEGWIGCRRPFGERCQRHLPSGRRRSHEDLVERRGIALQRRQHLHDHVVADELGEILRDLPLAEGVVKRVVDQLRRDSVSRRLVAVDLQRQRRAFGLLIGGDVAQLGQALQLGEDLRRPLIELLDVGALQRVLELRAAMRGRRR